MPWTPNLFACSAIPRWDQTIFSIDQHSTWHASSHQSSIGGQGTRRKSIFRSLSSKAEIADLACDVLLAHNFSIDEQKINATTVTVLVQLRHYQGCSVPQLWCEILLGASKGNPKRGMSHHATLHVPATISPRIASDTIMKLLPLTHKKSLKSSDCSGPSRTKAVRDSMYLGNATFVGSPKTRNAFHYVYFHCVWFSTIPKNIFDKMCVFKTAAFLTRSD